MGKRKLLAVFLMALVLMFGLSTVHAEAAAPSLNKTKITLNWNKKTTIKVKNATSKVKWSTSNKKRVKIVKTSGSRKTTATIQAVGTKGSATITAKVGKTKLKIKVTLKHKHKYKEATCTLPRTCACGATKGKALRHDNEGATCMSPQKCRDCGFTTGGTLPHNYRPATCLSQATCMNPGCGAVTGGLGAHSYNTSNQCTVCQQMNLNAILKFEIENTTTSGDYNQDTLWIAHVNNSWDAFRFLGGTTHLAYLYEYTGAAPKTMYLARIRNNKIETVGDYMVTPGGEFDTWYQVFYTIRGMDTFNMEPDGYFVFDVKYGDKEYRITLKTDGSFTFVRI